MILADRLAAALQRKGMSQSALARTAGVSATTINKLARGVSHNSAHIYAIARALDVSPAYLVGETEDYGDASTVPAALPPRDPDSVELVELDLAFGMGATFLDVPVNAKKAQFSRRWLRNFTNAPPDKLFFAHGTGDSMMPTINDRDMLLIDASDLSIRMADQMWAISYCGLGMIKRLRYGKDGGVRIMSDNPSVREDTAYDGELHLIGRVVAIIRRV